MRAKVAAMEAQGASVRGVLPFGDPRIDRALPGGGLPLGRCHEEVGEGLEIETAAAVAAFVAAVASPLAAQGTVVWVMRRDDLYAPGLASLGFPCESLIQVCVRDEVQALAALEDALAAKGVAAAIGETEAIDLIAGRRLQLACEKNGATGFLIRRRPFGGRPGNAASAAMATRWRIAPARLFIWSKAARRRRHFCARLRTPRALRRSSMRSRLPNSSKKLPRTSKPSLRGRSRHFRNCSKRRIRC